MWVIFDLWAIAAACLCEWGWWEQRTNHTVHLLALKPKPTKELRCVIDICMAITVNNLFIIPSSCSSLPITTSNEWLETFKTEIYCHSFTFLWQTSLLTYCPGGFSGRERVFCHTTEFHKQKWNCCFACQETEESWHIKRLLKVRTPQGNSVEIKIAEEVQ